MQADRLFETAQVGFDTPAAAIQLHHLFRRQRQGGEQVEPTSLRQLVEGFKEYNS